MHYQIYILCKRILFNLILDLRFIRSDTGYLSDLWNYLFDANIGLGLFRIIFF